MQIDTALGTVEIPALAVPGAEECFASAVRFAAKELSEYVRMVPESDRPSAELLARTWVGDTSAAAFLRDLEVGSTTALAAWTAWPWTRGVTQDAVLRSHGYLADQSRPIRAELVRARGLADRGQCDVLAQRTAGRWAGRYASRTLTMGQYRRRTGCKCPDPMHCQCTALLPPGGMR
jgi:hypothetical protein